MAEQYPTDSLYHSAEKGKHMIALLGNRLKKAREKQGLKQSQVASMIGVNFRQISAYEIGTREPSFEILASLANLYHVSSDYLLGIQKEEVIDVNELDKREQELIAELVQMLSDKNKQLEGRK